MQRYLWIGGLLAVVVAGTIIAIVNTPPRVLPEADDPAKPDLAADIEAEENPLETLAAAMQAGETEQVLEVLPDVLNQPTGLEAPEAWASLAEVAIAGGRFDLGVACYERAEAFDPENLQYVFPRLRVLYSAGLIDEARQAWIYQLSDRGLDLLSLPALGNEGLIFSEHTTALDGLGDDPVEDNLSTLARARLALHRGEPDRARLWLEPLIDVEDPPELLLAKWGHVLLETGEPGESLRVAKRLPENPRETASWIFLARVCRRLEQPAAELRCLLEAWQRNPSHYTVTADIGRLLEERGRSEDARFFVARSESLRRYSDACRLVHVAANPSAKSLQTAAREAEALSCLREARAWCEVASSLYPDKVWPKRDGERLSEVITDESGRYADDFDRREKLLDGLPLPLLPDAPDPDTDSKPDEDPDAEAAAGIRFEDEAPRLGLVATFDDGGDATAETTRLFEFTGGGVAVLDADLDGWPDLYFTQGGPAPEFGRPVEANESDRPRDRFYRNEYGDRFADVGELIGLNCDAYGQGCTVGDFNADGFPDLYVANVGRNRLYANNGDGTFSEMTPGELTVETWTTSCAIADFNGDGLADVYDVNHVVEAGVHKRMCRRGDGSVPCGSSAGLVAEQDRLLLNAGDGTLVDVTEACGLVADEGLGLGIVVADLDDDRSLDVFVANDARPNFLFVNEGATAGRPVFRERALIAGVAYNATGRAQACMGVAAGDGDGDGRLDLFVTNFYADHNTLYAQRSPVSFDDTSREAGLAAASHRWLGFGTQFLDADLDGRPDLVVANGDVLDFSEANPERPHRQPLQFFHKRSESRFAELDAANLGPVFDAPRVGRGLARIDWNRDGLDDFAVSNIEDPVSLITNRTETPHHFLGIRLVGTASERTAIGTRVTIAAGGRTATGQLTAGDGYMASNERQLLFGLRNADTVDRVEIAWPSGAVTTFESLPVDTTIVAIEGNDQPLVVEREP